MITNPSATNAYNVPTATPATRNCRKSFTDNLASGHERAACRPIAPQSQTRRVASGHERAACRPVAPQSDGGGGGPSSVEAFDQRLELLGNGGALDLLGRCQLALLL